MLKPDEKLSDQELREIFDDLMKTEIVTIEESARLDAEKRPFVPETDPRRQCIKFKIPEGWGKPSEHK